MRSVSTFPSNRASGGRGGGTAARPAGALTARAWIRARVSFTLRSLGLKASALRQAAMAESRKSRRSRPSAQAWSTITARSFSPSSA